MTTPVGEYPVPPSVQALLAAVWPAEQRLRTNDEFEWQTFLYYGGEGSETEPGLVVESSSCCTTAPSGAELDDAAIVRETLRHAVDEVFPTQDL
ncbi:hypothetical protein AB0L53_54015 [Nonomuraea sp. NPDC052129]|uniref:hypothetical protein n=1 Tax=Nonomuraea sp. NPDC052129 TaxID=3154651 RepID=UPI003422DD9D